MRFPFTGLVLACSALMSSLAQAAPASHVQVWFAPDNDTPDLVDLFRQPQLWRDARSAVSVLKLGPQQVDGRSGKNSLSELTEVGAFRMLQSWGIKLAIEAPAIKEWDCSGQKALDYTLRLVDNVAKAGGAVNYISMDEPLVAGMRVCGDTLETAAAKTANYVEKFASQAPEIKVGDIEAYPFNTVAQIRRWIAALGENGAKLDHFHLDVNVHFLDVHPEIDVRSDLKLLRNFFRGQNTRFGIIFWSGYDPAPTDEAYYRRTMAWVARVHAAIGAPDDAIFQSWVVRSAPRCTDTDPKCVPPHLTCTPEDGPGCGEHSVPINLPENNLTIFSHTRLINDAMAMMAERR